MTISSHRTGRILTAAALLPAIFFAVSTQPVLAADKLAQAAPVAASPAQPEPTAAKAERKSAERVEARIADLHKKLGVTADQEPLWTDVAQAMRDSGKKMRDSIAARSSKLKTMTAVDDLRSYRMIAEEHADGLKRLIPAFEALYAKMTPAQQKAADHVFAQHQERNTHRAS